MTRAVALAGLLVLVSIPRLADLERPGLTYDEWYDLEDSRRFCAAGTPLRPISDGYLNGQAPFFLACAVYAFTASHEVAARGLSVAASVFAVFATYLLARRFLRPPWALQAAGMLGLSPFFLSASRLAFSHGHLFALPWLMLALREVLASRSRLRAKRAALLGGALAGVAAGHDLLAVPWALSLLVLALARLRGRATRARQARFAGLFALAWLAGLALASPMYLARPLAAARDVAGRLAYWDAQSGHVWLGAEVERLPVFYYAVVLLVKLCPPVLLLLALGPWRRSTLAARVLLPSLWPLLLLAFKGWKSPFYLTPSLPLLYVVAAASLRRLVGRLPRPVRARAAVVATVVIAGVQAAWIVDTHPDHLMLGIRYGARLYGDFAGPAVSHGQWAREALDVVRRDAGRPNAVIAVPLGYAPRQIAHYAEAFGLRRVHTADQVRHGVNPRSVDYVIVSHDVLAHAEGRRFNQALLRLARDEARFELLATVRSAGFPHARVFKRRP